MISSSVISPRLARRASRNVKELMIEMLLLGAALVAVFTTAGIVYVLVKESWDFFKHVPLSAFLFDTSRSEHRDQRRAQQQHLDHQLLDVA